MTTPRYGLLFHFTHIDNLPAILEEGALLSDSIVEARGSLSTEAGNPAIKQRRREREVSCAPGGCVCDYVPFYFAARSPMMYVLWKGTVPSFAGDHRDLVYLVTDVDRIVQADLPFVISDRNAAKDYVEFSNDIAVLGDLTTPAPQSAFVDWPLMKEAMWSNTPDDPERMERRMAEFLVHGHVPLDLLLGAGVHSEDRQTMIEQLFATRGLGLRAMVRPNWYYS